MNYSSFIVKIIEIPKQSFFEDNTSVTEILVKFPQIQQNKLASTFRISIWGDLAYDAVKYYNVNDYIIIEGYISLKSLISDYLTLDKQIEISIFKIYPFIVTNIHPIKIDK
uniref:Single-stranded DNA binding protein n=1 Tax=Lithodesmium undulatum TaxID=59812 RepID=A0A023HC01_LITUN|nr:hypothetical protein [Lithodesmium undulatum]AGH28953.1 hypothetical protein [Lithodesmium undulatum]UYC30506.1 hypothetical protein [Lithodesmium undulatum]